MADLNILTNPEVKEANAGINGSIAVIVVPLKSGRFALFDRQLYLRDILDEAPSADAIRAFSLAFSTALSRTSEARFYGEPSDKQFINDLIRGERLQSRKSRGGSVIDIEL